MTDHPVTPAHRGSEPALALVGIDDAPVKRIHVMILLIVGAGLFFDTVESTMTNVFATVFSHDKSVSKVQLTLLLSSQAASATG